MRVASQRRALSAAQEKLLVCYRRRLLLSTGTTGKRHYCGVLTDLCYSC